MKNIPKDAVHQEDPNRHRVPYDGPRGGQYSNPLYDGQAAYDGGSEEGIDLMHLVQIGLRRWKTIFLVLVIAVGLGLLYLQFATPIYRATALLEMSVRKPRLVKESAVIEEQSYDKDMIFNTRLAKFKSRSMLTRVAKACLADDNADAEALEPMIRFLGAHTSWSIQRNSFIVEVSVEGPDPLFAQKAVNLYAESAVQMMIEENRTSSDNAVSWLQQQASQQKEILANAEQVIVDYRTSVSLDALRNRKRVSEEALIQLNEILIGLESKLITDQALLRYLDKIKENPSAAETVPSGVAETEQLKEFIRSWWDAKLALSGLQERYTGLHPEIKQGEAKLNQMRERLDGYLATVSKRVSNGVNLLQNQVQDIRDRIETETHSLLDLELQIVKAEGHLNTLIREQEAADTSYRSLLSRIEESRMAADENTAVLKLLQAAGTPGNPFSPNTKRILALAILLGGILGYGIAWLLEFLEDKLTGVLDLESIGLELLALIPKQASEERAQLATLCLQDKFSHVSETFASLRTVLTFNEAKDRYKCLLITSTQPEEGKTVVASNLAISMAQSGRKTVLIDFDLRRPRLRKIFPSATDAVSLLHTLDKKGYEKFEKLPVAGGHQNLSIITSKPSDSISPAEIIGGGGPAKLIAWARKNYDFVIIDSPPLGVVGDSQSIADHVDGVILVARPDYTRKRALRHTLERLVALNTNVIGAVLNNVEISRHSAYSNYYHHYGSYHAYGSYKADAEEKS